MSTATTFRHRVDASQRGVDSRSPNALRLLLAEADARQASRLATALRPRHVNTFVCTDGAEALLQVGSLDPDVILLGPGLPLVGAATFVRVLRRRSSIPVLLGVDDQSTTDGAVALAAGANASVSWPYRVGELLPLLRAAARKPIAEVDDSEVLNVGPVTVDVPSHRVFVSGRPVYLPMREFDVLVYLASRADRVVSREQLVRHLWGHDYTPGSDSTLTVHIKRIRERISENGANPQLIETVRGLGYRLTTRTDQPLSLPRPTML